MQQANDERGAKVRWEEMFIDELKATLAACPLCLLPYGLAEPHGPYNALGLDFLKAQALVERFATVHGGIVAPPLVWHVQEMPHFDWFGYQGISAEEAFASSLPAELFYTILFYQLRAVDARGFHAAVLITGHYGGLENDIRLVCEYYRRRTGTPMQIHACADWELIRYEDYRGDHAGLCETSQLLALRPELVDLERSVEHSPFGRFAGVSFPVNGISPSAELGERIVSSQIETLHGLQKALLTAYEQDSAYRAPDLNTVWDIAERFQRLTRKYWICSLTLSEYREGQRIPFPGWEALGE
jgi:creatinine amidohydrolase